MARRSRKSLNPTWVALICILIVVGFAGAFLLFRGANEPYRTTEELDPRSYLDNSNSLRGNVYRVQGEVINSLAWSPTEGRLIAVAAKQGGDVLPIIVPPDFNHINIQKGQRFDFMLEVDDKGLLKAKNLTKA